MVDTWDGWRLCEHGLNQVCDLCLPRILVLQWNFSSSACVQAPVAFLGIETAVSQAI